jgi:hypothetical protein
MLDLLGCPKIPNLLSGERKGPLPFFDPKDCLTLTYLSSESYYFCELGTPAEIKREREKTDVNSGQRT